MAESSGSQSPEVLRASSPPCCCAVHLPRVGCAGRRGVCHEASEGGAHPPGPGARQDIASRGKSEPDTVVEPDVAVDPLDSNIAVAAAHDSRFADGGAVGISVAWTSNGGATWHHKPAPGITTAAGGVWPRASDPVVAFGPDGTAYLSVLAIGARGAARPSSCCARRRRQDLKQAFVRRPRTSATLQRQNWLVVDTRKPSPALRPRVPVWTPFLSDGSRFIGVPRRCGGPTTTPARGARCTT